MIGDVALSPSGEPALHIHVVVGKRDGTALAGHLQEARVRPTLEVIFNESPAHLQKVHDPQSSLALIRPKQLAGKSVIESGPLRKVIFQAEASAPITRLFRTRPPAFSMRPTKMLKYRSHCFSRIGSRAVHTG